MRKIYTAILLSALALLAAACVKVNPNAGSSEPLTLGTVSTATSVSADGQPLAVATTFLDSTPAIYAAARVSNAPRGTEVRARWVYVKDNSGVEVNRQLGEDSRQAQGTQYVSFSRQPAGGAWEGGQYTVTLLLNGSEAGTANFTVRPQQSAPAQAPTISYFRAVPESISLGQPVSLSWATAGASKTEISTIGQVQASGSTLVVPATDTEYQLTAGNGAGSTSMKVSVRVTSVARNKPELAVTDFGLEGDRAWFKVKNLGGVQAQQSTTYLFVQGEHVASGLVDTLAPGEERRQYFSNFTWSYGAGRSYTLPVRACADGLDQVGEYDEANNCLTLDW